MLFFSHIGITTGLVKVCQELVTCRKPCYSEICLKPQSGTAQSRKRVLLNIIRDKMKSIDYRFVLLGSLLPDIIDKPIWVFTSNNFKWGGRGYAHTFLFSFLLFIVGFMLVTRWKKNWLITISLCSFIHLVFDHMWLNTTTLWWPLLGSIQRTITAGWLPSLWHGLISNPYDYVTETMGFIITLYIGLRLIMSGRVMQFLKTGDIDWSKSLTDNKATKTKAR